MKTSKYFLSFVGLNDPGHDAPNDGPLLSIVRRLQEDNIRIEKYFLFWTPDSSHSDGTSQTGTDSNLEGTVKRLNEIGIHTDQIVPVKCKVNPSVENEVMRFMIMWLDKNRSVCNGELLLNVASGTPAIRSSFTFMVGTQLIPNGALWYSNHPKHIVNPADLRVRVTSIHFGHWAESRKIYIAAGLMEAMAFSDAQRILSKIEKSLLTTERQEKITAWKGLLRAYSCVDRADHLQALKYMDQVLPIFRNFIPEFLPLLEKQASVLDEINAITEPSINSYAELMDIYASLSRRFATSHYSNVGTRARRIFDGVLHQLGQEAGIRLTVEKGVGGLMNELDKRIKLEGSKKIFPAGTALFAGNSYDLDAQIIAALGSTFYRKRRRIGREAIGDTMNMSIEVHGFVRPDEQDARDMIDAARGALEILHFGSRLQHLPLPGDLPFGSGPIADCARQIIMWV